MDDYMLLYYKLFNKITDIINELEVMQQEAEEIFIAQESKLKKLQTPAK